MAKLVYPIHLHAVHQRGGGSKTVKVTNSTQASQWVIILWKSHPNEYEFYISPGDKPNQFMYRIDITETKQDGKENVKMAFVSPKRVV